MVSEPTTVRSFVHEFTFPKTFSETALPIKAKFYMKHLKERGTNVDMSNQGHVTKMAAMSIYSKTRTNQSQSLCGASLGRGNQCIYRKFRSHDQNGRLACKW